MERSKHSSYAVTLPRLIGGTISVNFVNTLAWRGDPDGRGERLTSCAELLHWCEAADVLAPYERHELASEARERPQAAQTALAQAIGLRECLARLFATPDRSGPSDLAGLNRLFEAAPRRTGLARSGGGYLWTQARDGEPLLRPLTRIAADGAELLVSGRAARIRQCADPRCAWMFLDESRGRRRLWCSMDDCGNRAKARRHYAKRKSDI